MQPPESKTTKLSDDKLYEIAIRKYKAQEAIQGFLYGEYHVIRDLRKPSNEQEIWRRKDEAGSRQAYEEQLQIEWMRYALEVL